MRRLLVLAIAVTILAALAPAGHTEKQTMKLVRVKVTDAAQANDLMTNFDETHNHSAEEIEILAWPGDIARLEAKGYDYRVVIDDLLAYDQKAAEEAETFMVPLPGPDRDDYRILSDYNSEMRQLAKKNPKLVKLVVAPNPTLEGRKVLAVEIAANVKKQDGRPTLYIDGIHHAREWPAGEYPMIFAHYLVEGFGKNKAVTQVLKKGRVLIVPIVNADGFDYSRSSALAINRNTDTAHSIPCSAAGCEAYWRKNRRSLSGVTLPGVNKNPDAYGVDPNRNYSFKWGGPGASGDRTSQTHYGEAPFSEPESKNVEQLVLSRNVTSLISNHTSGRLVLRAWGDTFLHAPDEKYLFKLGAKYAKAMGGYSNIKGMQLYATTGTTSDWGYGVLGIPSYTFEHGFSFHPPYADCESDCVGKQWKGVMKAYMIGAKAAQDRDAHGVITGKVSGGKAKLTLTHKIKTPITLEVDGKKVHNETLKTTMTTAKNGKFTWDVPPSVRPALPGKKPTVDKYTLTVSGKGGKATKSFVLRAGQKVNLGTIRL